MKKIIIYSYPRTGSTFFCKALNSCSNVICHSEIYHKNFDHFRRSFLDDNVISAYKHKKLLYRILNTGDELLYRKLYNCRNRNPKLFNQYVFNFSAGIDAISFKIFPNQNDKMLKYYIKSNGYSIIFLYRENIINSLVSQKIAYKTGKWDSTYDKRERVKITLTLEEIHAYHQKLESYKKLIEDHIDRDKVECLDISYEEITTEFPAEKISTFLDMELRSINLETGEKKQNIFEICDIIENFDNLLEESEGSSYYSLLSGNR